MPTNFDNKSSDLPKSNSTSHATGFFKTDGGKTKSNAIDIPSISLPKGGGAIKGIDEKFSVNAVNGSSSFSIPLPFSAARGAAPAMSLSYNSGAGNGIFGLGWSLGMPSIKRKTEKGLPQYIDGIESDVFLFSEAEDLVPEFKKEQDGSFSKDDDGEYIIYDKEAIDGSCIIRSYKPRTEGLFARIERWTEKSTGIIKWRVITKENQTTLFGWSNSSVIADPEDPVRIFEWLPEFVFDDKGNCSHYRYKKEDDKGFDPALLHNRNRLANGHIAYTNLYLEKVLYGNKQPYKKFGDAYPAETAYMFETVFDYGEYDSDSPYAKINDWDFRTDAFSDYKAGFEIRTTRLCKRVLLFHQFTGDNEYAGLVKSVDFDYDTALQKDFTFLRSITSCGYIKKTDNTYSSKQLPPTEFEYQQYDWNNDVKIIDPEALVHAPSGLDERSYQFTDLYNEGLSGLLTEQANGWYYKHNLGEGKFAQAKLVSSKPSFNGLGKQMQLLDLDADGRKQLVSYAGEPKGYFELNDESEWQPFRNFESLPAISFDDPNARMLDLDGDGRPEVVITEDNVFTWYQSDGRRGFSQVHTSLKPYDEEAGPHILFADATQGIFLADMSGDGMTDIVRIRNGEVCYWPNLGYGKFGTKVAMDNAPLFDHPEAYNAAFLKLADIDGSGTTDIIYLGKNKFSCWMNLSGNRFNTIPFEINAFPAIHNQAKITITDLLGNGVACIVWSGALPADAGAPLKYIDLMNSKKPHVMVFYKNNLGKEVTIEYSASTKFYLQDKLAGRPWITRLHFPVHCISKTRVRDKISGWNFISSYTYHHGYYDHAEREFRGFGMVEQTDAEHFEDWVKTGATNIVERDLHQEPVVTKSWFHTGAVLQKGNILNQYEDDYWYKVMQDQEFEVIRKETMLPDAQLIVAPGMASSVIEDISALEWQQALRACKGMTLRAEIFAKDAGKNDNTIEARKKELTPFSVATHNCVIELLQPKGKNRHAIFIVKESESITYSYERNTEDPRIAHGLNIKLDEYGNVLESVAIVYPRLLPDMSLPQETQQEQSKTMMIYSQHQFTNDVVGEDDYRLRMPAEAKTFELKGVAKTNTLYRFKDFEDILNSSVEVAYHNIDVAPAPGSVQRRLIEHVRTTYFQNTLGGPLSLYKLQSLAIPFESYQLAYTPELVTDIYGTKANDALFTEGRFVHSEGDDNWWLRSGTTQFINNGETVANAQDRFYLPHSYTDPYGSITSIKYDSSYFLFIEETEDVLGNTSIVDLFNFRTLSPQRMRDINNNLSETVSDEIGQVKAMAIFGKGNEADDLSGITEHTDVQEQAAIDNFFAAQQSSVLRTSGKVLLQHATARFVYDLNAYVNAGKPVATATIVRQEHFQKNNDSPVQLSFEYAGGMGKVIMKKTQAEPGLAKKMILGADLTYTIVEEDTAASVPKQLRWIGNGRTILNNKGNPVKQYEPYFSVTHLYEEAKELVETGVSPLMYYDAMGRLVRTDLPGGTFSKVEFNSWKQIGFDANDTVLESSWYNDRTNHLIDAALVAAGKDPSKEKAAADKTAKHANTANVLHLDTLGRPVLSVDHNRNSTTGADEFYRTKLKIDAEGNLRSVNDSRELPTNNNKGNTVMQYKYDMLGGLVYQSSMDAGQRWIMINVMGNSLRTWDERNHELQYFYDNLHRPLYSKVIGGDGGIALNNVFDRIIYGEDLLLPGRTNEAALQARNVLGQMIKHYDTGGLIDIPRYDFKGQTITTTRILFKKYKEIADWTDANLIGDLETGTEFVFTNETDALGRLVKEISPDGSIITPSYNETGLLNRETVLHPGATIPVTYINAIEYNEKGQRNKIIYGNNVITRFYYDKDTFKLRGLESNSQNGDPLQHWQYTYDPVGNITHIEDRNIPVVFFNNQKVTGVSAYTYDALYRLAEATGRENNAALMVNARDNWNDEPFMQQLDTGDPMSLRNYTQAYQYDSVGNILQIRHQAAGNNQTRNYSYQENNNRLINTSIGGETYSYPHHAQHGYIIQMPHLDEIGWSFKEELIKSINQRVSPGNGTAETTYYQYNGKGQRIRKITENFAAPGNTATRKEERIYISGYESYRTYERNSVNFERESLSLLDKGHRFVMIETVKQNTGTASDPSKTIGVQLIRYQLHNHIGSASLELDDNTRVISYEEFHPYGTTAYLATDKNIKAAAKRYRYTGMERDEETGLEYHSARYYLPWLARWLSTDPIGIGDGCNVYSYSSGCPVNMVDRTGKQSVSEGSVLNTIDSTLTAKGIGYNTEVTVKFSIQMPDGSTTVVYRRYDRAFYIDGELQFLEAKGSNLSGQTTADQAIADGWIQKYGAKATVLEGARTPPKGHGALQEKNSFNPNQQVEIQPGHVQVVHANSSGGSAKLSSNNAHISLWQKFMEAVKNVPEASDPNMVRISKAGEAPRFVPRSTVTPGKPLPSITDPPNAPATPAPETPVVETPVVETPVVETPVTEAPVKISGGGALRGGTAIARVGNVAGSAFNILGALPIITDVYKGITGTDDGAIYMLQVPGGQPWIFDRQKYFRIHMKEYGYDIPALEGKTLELEGDTYIIQNGLPVQIGGPGGGT